MRTFVMWFVDPRVTGSNVVDLAIRVWDFMRILVTGHRGYVGSVLTSVLQQADCDIVGFDADLYRGCDFGRIHNKVTSLAIDIRDVEVADLLSFDAVVHLAALSDDASGSIDPMLTEEVNHNATVRLAECCKQAGVERLLFASSCSVYGRGGQNVLVEESPIHPLTHYAESKLACERDLASLADSTFSPVFLRIATAYGVSPQLRLDLVVNDFVSSAVTRNTVAMRTAGVAWRPLIHVEDIARAFAAVLRAPTARIHNQVFNVARGEENYRVVDIADKVTELVPPAVRAAAAEPVDERSYRVEGSKLLRACPSLKYQWSLPRGIEQLRNAMCGAGLTPADWRCDRYRRAPRLRMLLERRTLDADLRPRRKQPAKAIVVA